MGRLVAVAATTHASWHHTTWASQGKNGFKRSPYWARSGLVFPARQPVWPEWPRLTTVCRCRGAIFVCRLRNPVGGHFGADCERQCLSRLEGCSSLWRRMPRCECRVSRTTIGIAGIHRRCSARVIAPFRQAHRVFAVPRPPLLDPPGLRAVRRRAAPAPAPPAVGAPPGRADSPALRPTGGR